MDEGPHKLQFDSFAFGIELLDLQLRAGKQA